jgi:hypothetical protein
MRLHFPNRRLPWRVAAEILACWLLVCATGALVEWGLR